jgi:acetylornithine deacetylase/succinyl-diaminopimelate desuccinylase-like protein
MPNLEKIYRYIEDHKSEHIAKVQEYLRQPSISAENKGIRECAKLLMEYYRRLGCREVELVETEGHPCIWAYYEAGAPKTLINYCMYDVQPVAGEVWTFPPFEATLVEKPPFKKVVIARGAFNSKGGYRMWLNALEAIIAVEGTLPVNIMFTAEGEEELGSPHLEQFIRQYQDRLRQADAVLNTGPSQQIDGSIRMAMGAKGIFEFELECSGSLWGRGPREFDVHSSMKAAADSPIWRFIHALASLTSEDGNTVQIEGFYDNVLPPSEEDLELIDRLEKTFNPEVWQRMFKIDRWIDDLQGRDLLIRFLYSPTLNIQGIYGGHIGAGSKTVLPHKVTCTADIRLVPKMTVNEVMTKLRAHLDRRGYTDIRIKPLAGYPPAKVSYKTAIAQAVIQTYRKNGIEPQIWPISGGSWPMYLYCGDPINLPYCSGGLGHGGNAHSPDEYLVIEGDGKVAGIVEAEKSYVDILYNYAGIS